MLPMQSNGRRHRLPVAVFGFALATFGLQSQAQSPDTHEGVYNGEVGRIINENCVVCHREGGIGPMQFHRPQEFNLAWTIRTPESFRIGQLHDVFELGDFWEVLKFVFKSH